MVSFLKNSGLIDMESPLSLVFLSHTSFLPSLGENYIRIYIPDSLL